MRFLKQSTSVDLPIGPFLDSTDAITAKTALTITQPDVRLKKNGAAWAQKAAAQTLSHEENGYYEVTLDATDTDTLGQLRLAVAESGALPIWEDFTVLPADVYDALVSGTGGGVRSTTIIDSATSVRNVNVSQISTDSGAADNLEALFDGNGYAATGTLTNVTTVATTTSLTNNTPTAGTITLLGANAIAATSIASDAITAAKVASDVSAEIADAVWDEDATGHQTGGTFGQAIGDPGADATTMYQAIVTDAAGTHIAADIIAIEGQTDDIGAAGAGLTAVPWNAAWDAEVQSEVDDALVARNLDKLVLASGTADSGSTTTMVDAALTQGDNDWWKGRMIVFTSGTLAGQCAIVTDFVAATDTITFAPPVTAAVSTHTYVILPGVSTWDDTLAEHLISGSTGAALNAAGSAGDPWNTALPGAYGAGTAGKIVGDNINATVSSRASQTSVDTIDDFLDTEIAAIKTKTDFLPSAAAGASGGLLIAGSNAGLVTFANGLRIERSTANADALSIAGNGTGYGINVTGGDTGHGIVITGGSTSGDGINLSTTSGHGIIVAATGTSKHGIQVSGGNGGTSDGVKFIAGTGGVAMRSDITGNITGNVSGSVGSVTGAVGSVSGAVGSVTGNVGGNVVGSTASVTGAVGSVTGNVGGNVVGSTASVTGAVGSVTGNVGGNVTGSVGSVATGGITAASIADNAIDQATFASDTTIKHLDTALELDGAVYRYTTNALELAPTGGSAPSAATIADAVWDEVQSGHTTAGTFGKFVDAQISAISSGGLTGPNSVTITFEDENTDPVPLVEFTVVGQGTARANTSGVATFGLATGTYTLAAAMTDLVVFANTSLAVTGTTTTTISGTGVILPSITAVQTVGTLVTTDAEGAVQAGVEVEFQAVTPADGDGYGMVNTIETATSNGSGVVTHSFLKGGHTYQWRRGNGRWKQFTTPETANTFTISSHIGTD